MQEQSWLMMNRRRRSRSIGSFGRRRPGGPDIARLATIRHGDAVLALGSGVTVNGPPNFDNIGNFSPLPLGVDADIEHNPYLAPDKRLQDKPLQEFVRPHQSADLAESGSARREHQNHHGDDVGYRVSHRRHPQHSVPGQAGERHAKCGRCSGSKNCSARSARQSTVHAAISAARAAGFLPDRGCLRGAHPLAAYLDQHDETGGEADELTRRASVQPSS